uniref:Uncharacterized protein n=1 Tax=Anguilla anguilla TaxID=7936 RepID=A0A0E9U454_ANGAN
MFIGLRWIKLFLNKVSLNLCSVMNLLSLCCLVPARIICL